MIVRTQVVGRYPQSRFAGSIPGLKWLNRVFVLKLSYPNPERITGIMQAMLWCLVCNSISPTDETLMVETPRSNYLRIPRGIGHWRRPCCVSVCSEKAS
jgi:hypothetical protein